MNLHEEFNRAVDGLEVVLRDESLEPPLMRAQIKALITGYSAKTVVAQAYASFQTSGVVQMKTFLRAANVQSGELSDAGAYRARVLTALESLRQFGTHLSAERAPSPA